MQPMSRLVPGGTEQIGLPVPKAVLSATSCGRRAVNTPGQPASAPAVPALPPAAPVGAAQRTATGIVRLCGRRDPAADALPLMRMPVSSG